MKKKYLLFAVPFLSSCVPIDNQTNTIHISNQEIATEITKHRKNAKNSKLSRDYLERSADSTASFYTDLYIECLKDNAKYVDENGYTGTSPNAKDQARLLATIGGKKKSIINPKNKAYLIPSSSTITAKGIEAADMRVVIGLYKDLQSKPWVHDNGFVRSIRIERICFLKDNFTVITYFTKQK